MSMGMNLPMHRNKSVMSHDFSMTPRADVPRSTIHRPHGHTTTFDASYLIPIFYDEVYPGDSMRLNATMFARLATPIYPIMDNMRLDSFFFFVPNRLVWENWQRFMGEQDNPADTISFTIPQMVSKASGYDVNTIFDYFGLPTAGQVAAAATYSHSSLFFRAYNLIWNQWFRDENLQDSAWIQTDDGPDLYNVYSLLKRGKRHDYFTSCLPWPQKGGTAVTLPLGSSAPLKSDGTDLKFYIEGGTQRKLQVSTLTGAPAMAYDGALAGVTDTNFGPSGTLVPGLYADLSSATSATINAIRLAFQTQKLLERDARGGTRYTEIVRSHFGVISPDARLQRPEYLGGGSTPITINPVVQTSGTSVTGSTTPLGQLAATGGVVASHGFSKSFTEHGMIIGLICVTADLRYQQGLDRMWSRSTRYDYYFPAFAHIGEQAVKNKEIYCKGDANDDLVFGYIPAWDELRYKRSMITGQFRSTYATPLDAWHLAQKFTALPTLNTTFIQDDTITSVNRAVAVTSSGKQFLFDGYFDYTCARPIPMHSVPGLIDHF